MGSSLSKKEALAIIASPENKEELERLFRDFDKDKNGALDAKEWQAFGKLLWEVDVEQANEAGRQEVDTQGPAAVQLTFIFLGDRGRAAAITRGEECHGHQGPPSGACLPGEVCSAAPLCS